MFYLERFENTSHTDGKWTLYARHESRRLLEEMISNKEHPELFRISEHEQVVEKEKYTRCLIFRVYDIYAAGRIEGKLSYHGIQYTSKNVGDYILFNVMRSDLKWRNVIEMILSVHNVRYYFDKINTEEAMPCV